MGNLFTNQMSLIAKDYVTNESNKTTLNRNDWIVIGISGVTCGGKTTITNSLKNLLTPVFTFNQDKYFYPDDSPHHIKCEGVDHNDYDILSALDMEKMYSDILCTLNGDDKAHARTTERHEGSYEVNNKKFLIVEGFTALNYKPIFELCDLKYYFVLNLSDCIARRKLRTYDPPDIPGYFENCVWPRHLFYKEKIQHEKSVTILDGMNKNNLEIILRDLGLLGASTVKK